MLDPNDGDKAYYISADGQACSTPQEAIEAGEAFETASGQSVTGGNCGQDAANISDDK